MERIQMVDLGRQYGKIKEEINLAIQNVLDEGAFINGPQVKLFSEQLQAYLNVSNVIPCANGTDALQIAMMALDLKPGDEVIVPAFTYVATVEVIALLGLIPVFVDVNEDDFNLNVNLIEKAITKRTKCIVPVHLYGQCTNMEPLLKLATKYGMFVIEDAAQAIGADYFFADKSSKKAGTMGTIGTTSFFPSKNLGCFGDGGALFVSDDALAEKIRMIANHGQKKKYYHDIIGVNSRLDTLQAAILTVKLKHLDHYSEIRNKVAEYYDTAFKDEKRIIIPTRTSYSNHVFHQYTIKLNGYNRDKLKEKIAQKGVPSMIYYPVPVHLQQAYKTYTSLQNLEVSEHLCKCVLSLPIHSEMTNDELHHITSIILSALD